MIAAFAWVSSALKLMIEFTKDSKSRMASIMVLLAAGVVWAVMEVNKKHEMAMEAIEKRTAPVAQLVTQQALISASLEDMKGSMLEIKGSVKETEKRVWQIQRDVYTLKSANEKKAEKDEWTALERRIDARKEERSGM